MKNNYSNEKRKRITVLAAVLCIVAFTVCLYFAKYPIKLGKIVGSSNKSFDISSDFIKFLDVGQGDSALIYSNGYTAMIDMGLPTTANDVCLDLADYNIKDIDVAMASHLHSDHIGGLKAISENYSIKNLIMPEILENSLAAAKNVKEDLVLSGTKFYNARQGINFKIGEFEITVLGLFDNKSDENNRSVFTVARIKDKKFIFTGDAEFASEKSLLNEKLNLDCDVLKVSHHGSNTSTSPEFLKAVTPEYAVISVGEDNIYSHPNQSTITALEASGAKVFRTDKNGDIIFNIDDGKIKIKTEK